MHRRLQFWPDAGWSLEPAPRRNQCTAAWHVRIKVRIKVVVCRMTAQPCGILVSNRSFAQLRGYNQRALENVHRRVASRLQAGCSNKTPLENSCTAVRCRGFKQVVRFNMTGQPCYEMNAHFDFTLVVRWKN